ncbi:ADP-ribosylation factor-like protein 16 [Macrosteles quadrilineatus]|uniref:ADP-ribosylation factor-like protein 16 n=1 Tax=Macrosteles quadrilineatus TaxID=74068 RepID=UPI0023E2613B|nr:ADP-ribosylation factor-like protein 16 [Macrosteles quadrilineatus]XP_054257804.1 ADP-ribosylation factor-like protein 16 [Macrosteles quadrilineatus]
MLLRKLQGRHVVDNTTATVPTTGTNLVAVTLFDQSQITIRELGGPMAPMWCHYYQDITKVMFVVDASNLCQIAAAGVLLYTILAEPQLQKVKIMMVLAKMDASYRQMRNEALLMLQYNRLKQEVPQNITIAEVSATTGEGISTVISWLGEKHSCS